MITIKGKIDTKLHKKLTEEFQNCLYSDEVEKINIEIIDCNGSESIEECASLAQLIDRVSRQKPVIAYIRGIVSAGGILIATACTSVYAESVALIGGLEFMDRDTSDLLIDLVSQYRGIDFNLAIKNFENGELLLAKDAKLAGLIDNIL